MRKELTHKDSLSTSVIDEAKLFHDLRELIHSVRYRVAIAVNAEQSLLYWQLGKRIRTENLADGRGAYGKKILATLSQKLVAEFGDGYSYSALTRMVRFADLFSDEAILVTLLQHLGWSIRVAEYLTELPPLKLLQSRLHRAIELAREETARMQLEVKG
ncbi:MAG: DUF1016 N-terminal domain-containing protein [bacterium]|nr:DUF1016 N-terminal domain-containing protein [bacterium]